jgi:hypothetical protein
MADPTPTPSASPSASAASMTAAPAMQVYDPSAPIVHDLKLSKDAEEWLKTISPGLFQNYQQIQTAWNYPLTQFSLTLMGDPQFRSSVAEMYGKHALGTYFGYELCWIVLVWILRAWRVGRAATWLKKLWTQAWIGIVFWIGSIAAIPFLVWGDSYRTAMSHLAKAIFKHFLA